MAVSPRVYRSLLRLYPSEFRHEFGIDLALHFDDLVASLGTGRAWRRTAIDLTVTIPRYRLEHHMSEQHAASTTVLLVGACAAGSAGPRTANGSPSGVQKSSLVNRSRYSPRQISNSHTKNTTIEGDHTMNTNTSRIAAALAAVGLLAAVAIGSGVGASKGAVLATAEIQNASGVIGFAKFIEDGSGRVHVKVKVDGLSPGLHGIHIHSVGTCTLGTTPPFSSAGGHFDPLTTAIHGEHNPLASDGVAPDGYHAGDLPNLVVDADGRGVLNGETNGATLSVGVQSLLDTNGSAIVIHALPDDLTNNPIGGSGTRIACGVIVPK